MTELAQKISSLRVPQGSVGVIFMGQAGFLLKSPSGCLMGIDLYLSNCCERYFGFKRLMPQLLLPGELVLDHVVASHAHYDHFDVDSIPILLSNGTTRLLTAPDGAAECRRLGIPEEKYTVLRQGQAVRAGEFTVLPVPCDHGALAPDAVGLYITCGDRTLYFAGDTCYRADIAERMRRLPVDFAAAPINGAFGNMNAEEAARFFKTVAPKLCVPCHYWNFAQHMGDPNAFLEAMGRTAGAPDFLLMYPGEILLLPKTESNENEQVAVIGR